MMSVASGASATPRLVVIVAYLLLISHIVIQLSFGASLSEFSVDKTDPNYWLKRRNWFYKQTKFELSDDNHRLLGTKRLLNENKSAEPVGHLPFWFDYELFKEVFNKHSADNKEEELARHNAYINTCLRVLKARVLYRMLAGTSDTFITSDADKFHWEKFGQVQKDLQEGKGNDNNEISFSVGSRIVATPSELEEAPLDRAIRLIKHEMDIVESRNQVVTNLRAFKELDGSAIKAKLPY